MAQRLRAGVLLGSILLLSGRAGAEPASSVASRAQPTPSAQPALKAAQVRRDPRGVKGISPFREAIARGDGALLRHDFDAALAAYREAIAREPENALGYYRNGQAQVQKGDLHEAETAFSTGLHVLPASKDPALRAKLLFALADLRERQKAYDDAIAKWTEYESLTTPPKKDASESVGFAASGSERKRVVEAWKKLSAEALQVKARIEKGVQSADEAVRKSSK